MRCFAWTRLALITLRIDTLSGFSAANPQPNPDQNPFTFIFTNRTNNIHTQPFPLMLYFNQGVGLSPAGF